LYGCGRAAIAIALESDPSEPSDGKLDPPQALATDAFSAPAYREHQLMAETSIGCGEGGNID